jgi:hypothetical protein
MQALQLPTHAFELTCHIVEGVITVLLNIGELIHRFAQEATRLVDLQLNLTVLNDLDEKAIQLNIRDLQLLSQIVKFDARVRADDA